MGAVIEVGDEAVGAAREPSFFATVLAGRVADLPVAGVNVRVIRKLSDGDIPSKRATAAAERRASGVRRKTQADYLAQLNDWIDASVLASALKVQESHAVRYLNRVLKPKGLVESKIPAPNQKTLWKRRSGV